MKEAEETIKPGDLFKTSHGMFFIICIEAHRSVVFGDMRDTWPDNTMVHFYYSPGWESTSGRQNSSILHRWRRQAMLDMIVDGYMVRL